MMRTHRLTFLIIGATMAATLLLLSPASAERETGKAAATPERDSTAAQRQERLEKLLEQTALARGVTRERLAVGDLVIQKYPLTGAEISQAKFIDRETGEVFAAAIDAAGKPADWQAAAALERQAKTRRYGKIDPTLQKKIEALERSSGAAADSLDAASAPASPKLPVSFWLNVPDMPAARQQSVRDPYVVRANLTAHLAALESDMTPKRQGALAAVKRFDPAARGAKYAPAVFATLTPAQIRAVVKRGDVDAAYDGAESNTLHNDDLATTARTYAVWNAGNLGQLNFGMVRPVVHEPDGIADFNPLLNNGSHAVIFWCTPGEPGCSLGFNNVGGATAQQHATWVAGVIGSTHPLLRGVAPSSQVLLSANSQTFTDANAVDSFEWARFNGGDPTNMSWGSRCGGGAQNFISRYVDWAVANLFATIVISAGNKDGCSTASDPNADLYVSSPGLAWSAITVGSQYDNGNGFWAGDGMSSFSRYVNPTFATGMEKPEVVAVGENVRTTDNQGDDNITGGGVSGTSFAAPAVAGQVALMLSRQPGQTGWPETNKAAVLASAFHDVDIGSRSKDGVGSVVMTQSDDTYRLGRFRNDCGPGCFPLQASDFPRNYTISLTAGQVVRVVIAWDSQSTGGGSDVLGADIDLTVFRPGGATVASSASFQNAWELVEFTAPVTGTYTVRANLFSSISGWSGTFLGMAYSVRALPNYCTGVPTGAGTFAINTANGPTWFDTYSGWGFDQSGREYIRKIVLGSTKDITVTDTNGNIDLHVLQIPNCAADPVAPAGVAHGLDSVFVDNAPAGTYYVVADGFNGTVGGATLKITLSGP